MKLSDVYFIVVLVLALALMMFLSYRKNKQRQHAATKLQDELRPGQRVCTLGGVVGRIKEIREENPQFKTVLLETGNAKNPAYMLFDIKAIYGVIAEEGHTLTGEPVAKKEEKKSKKS